jgi:hypothetical protein
MAGPDGNIAQRTRTTHGLRPFHVELGTGRSGEGTANAGRLAGWRFSRSRHRTFTGRRIPVETSLAAGRVLRSVATAYRPNG